MSSKQCYCKSAVFRSEAPISSTLSMVANVIVSAIKVFVQLYSLKAVCRNKISFLIPHFNVNSYIGHLMYMYAFKYFAFLITV